MRRKPIVMPIPAPDHPHAEMATTTEDTSGLVQALQELHVSRDRYHTAVARAHKLSSSELNCLRLLDVEGPQKSNRIAEFLGVTPSAVTAMINTLVRRGYAVRVDHPSDRRIVLIQATHDGGTVARSVADQLARHMPLSPAEMSRLQDSVLQMAKVFEAGIAEIEAC